MAIESIGELRHICQAAIQQDPNWYMRYVTRRFSIHLTRLLIPTSVTPNQVSIAMMVTGLMAGVPFAFPSPWMFLAGALILHLWYILDNVDGELARYRYYRRSGNVDVDKTGGSSIGQFLDMINHFLIHPYIPFCIGWGLFLRYQVLSYRLSQSAIVLGFLVGLVFTLLGALRYTEPLTFYYMLCGLGQSAKYSAVKVKTRSRWLQTSARARLSSAEASVEPSERREHRALRRFFGKMHLACHFAFFMAATGLIGLLGVILPPPVVLDTAVDYRLLLLMFYLALGSFVWLFKVGYIVYAGPRYFDRKFTQIFEEVQSS